MKFDLKKFFSKKKEKKVLVVEEIVKSNKKSHKVLIVDDADVNRYILKKFITKIDPTMEIVEVATGEEAIDSSLNNSFDIIWMDIKLGPGIDGNEATREILKLKPDQIVIGVTGQVEANSVKISLEAGMKSCIAKPISLSELKIMIEMYSYIAV